MPGVLWGGGGGWGEDRREGEGATPRIGVGTQHRGCPSACIEDMGLWEWQVCVHCPNAPPLKCILHPRVIVKVKLEPPLGSAGFPPTFSTVPQRPGPLNLAPPNPVILTSSPLPKPRLLGSFIRTFGRQEPSLLSLQFSSWIFVVLANLMDGGKCLRIEYYNQESVPSLLLCPRSGCSPISVESADGWMAFANALLEW